MSAAAAAFRRARLPRPRLHLRRQRVRLAIALALICAVVLGGGWLLVRDSSLVSVEHVTVEGIAGSDAGPIEHALDAAARRMTTLDVQTSRLRAAVARFPDIKRLQVSARFPHGLVIRVLQTLPVGLVEVDGRRVPVTGDGTLLPRVTPAAGLPLISLATPPSAGRLTRPGAVAAARLLGAAPYRLLARVAGVSWQGEHGLVAQLRNGPSIYFGQGSELAAKWTAAVAVLADPSSAGASYIDVVDPGRPAAGTSSAASSATAGASTTTTAAASTPTPGGG